jgi:hypothetical protein
VAIAGAAKDLGTAADDATRKLQYVHLVLSFSSLLVLYLLLFYDLEP